VQYPVCHAPRLFKWAGKFEKGACITTSIGKARNIFSDCDDPGIARWGSEM
jgi:hypothetical protein